MSQAEEERFFKEQVLRKAKEREQQQELMNQDAERKAHFMRCPKCGGHLESLQHEAIEIDRCKDCKGVWLDAGELEQLTERERSSSLFGFLSRRR